MNVKAEVSGDYLQHQMKLHGDKPYPDQIDALISGMNRTGSIGKAIAKHIVIEGGQIRPFVGDVRNVILFSDQFNTLICCHGVSHLDWFEDAPMSKMQEIVDVNLTGTIRMVQTFVQATMNTPVRKRIIIIGSMAHRSVLNGSAAYCASKAGLNMLVRCLAWELAPKAFDCYIIHPSNTLGTPMSEETIAGLERYRELKRNEAEAYWNDSPIRPKSLTTNDIADLSMYILSGRSPYLSGCAIELSGGQR